ncbi:Plasmodesmata-located protein 8 isoform 1 [Theobroma cacao]|uniref:Plasmodesmata-located protein 8 isoform 1 n=1 Tax=Theobroma cacao TaxID=3641 RepID=A0A061DU08_THECC|nr:Plasmodesmata-located protein 8 isoform 1 [Theobroma cacao]
MLGSLQSYSTHKTIQAPGLSTLCFLFFSLSYFGHLVKAHIFIYAGCSQEKYAPNSPFEGNLNSFLASVVSSSSQVSYNTYAIGNESSTPPESTLYGLYQCRGDLQTADCSRCMESVVNQIGLVCPYSYGASLQLEGCYLRYEHANFLGTPDTGLRFKKCSKSVNNDVEFFRRRDDVLADLQAAIGFKVSSSGLVEGFAQCLGDLSSSDCSSCLGDAVGKLKSVCGSAAAADVFLGQCYARYWASGYYGEFSPDSSHEDDIGKTVAIIVGVLAGLAVLIVLLSFCRKAMGKTLFLVYILPSPTFPLHHHNCRNINSDLFLFPESK